MPRLTTLKAHLVPDTDLSKLPCSWKSVQFVKAGPELDHHQLLRLPLENVTEIYLYEEGVSHPSVHWCFNASDSIDTTTSAVHKVSQILAQKWADQPRRIILDWSAQPTFHSHRVLAALAPLNEVPGLGLHLSEMWNVTDHHAHELQTHLPNLQQLEIHASTSFPKFAAAVATGSRQLRSLTVHSRPSEFPLTLRDALVGMALVRASKDAPLTIHVPHMTRQQAQELNQVLQSYPGFADHVRIWQ